VAVLDEAEFDRAGTIRVRWHPENPVEPDADGRFIIRNDNIKLSGRIIALDGEKLQFKTGRHKYEPPYNKDRMGNPLPQRNEPYMDATAESRECRILSLFAVYGPDAEAKQWVAAEDGWQIDTVDGPVTVEIGPNGPQAGDERR
jgi:hypothetical protein